MPLSHDEIRRYARHLLLPEVGLAGQHKLRAARVVCVGAGGLGSPVAIYLAAAGIGRLGIVDHDRVELTNLQRQILHGTGDVGRAKTESAGDTLRRLNPHVELVLHPVRLNRENARQLLGDYDLVVDGTDNFATRYLTNDACVLLKKPNIYGSIYRFDGQASVFAPHQGGPCYRCLYPEPPPPELVPSCAEGGVLGVLPGIVGCIQATETLKWILGRGTSLLGRLLLVNALDMKFRELRVRRDPACPVCGDQPTIRELTDEASFCPPNRRLEADDGPRADEVTVQDLRQALAQPERGIQVLDVREPFEHELVRLEGVRLIPLSALEQRWSELDPQGVYFLCCQTGARSRQAAALLRQRGFPQVKSVRGGLRAWAAEVDPAQPVC
jgi:adenylyltransferase/sulfurtransferase